MVLTGTGLDQPVLRRVARFLDGVRDEGLPDAVAEQGARLVLDTAGCMVAGAGEPTAAPLVDSFGRWAGAPIADVIGTGIRTSPADAAFVNSYTADLLDFEETLVSHPSAAVLAAGFAVGQDVGATGEQVVRAVMAGYEVGSRLGAAVMPSSELTREVAVEFWWKSIAAAVTAGMLLGVRGDQWADTIGYAASASPVARRGGFEFRPLSQLKANYSGQTHAGVVAAYLTAGGFRTYRAMLDGPRTFAQLLGSDRWRPELLVDGLGEVWRSERIGFKVYPACLYLHSLLESIEIVRGDPEYRPDRVRAVRASVPALVHDEMDVRRPGNVIDAQFSAPFAAAAFLLDGTTGPRSLSEQRLTDPAILALADRIELVEDPAYTEHFRAQRTTQAAVEVELDDGTRLTAEVTTVRGSAARPLSTSELAEKFVSCVEGWLEPAPARVAAERLLSIADADRVDDVVASLRQPTSTARLPNRGN
jgi:2-methylcitrate dehydratase PrpD